MQKEVPPLEYDFDGLQPNTNVVYMLRTAQQHHVQLSMMADQKASFLIAASFLMLTIVFSRIESGTAPAALITLGLFTLPAAIFAVLAVIPRSHVKSTGFNPLFFGTFARMTPEGFMEEMRNIIDTDSHVFRAMAIDIYQMGCVLYRRKYRYLTVSYRIFLCGLLVTPVVALIDMFDLMPL